MSDTQGNSEGKVFTDIAPGKYTIDIVHSGDVVASYNVTVSSGVTTILAVACR